MDFKEQANQAAKIAGELAKQTAKQAGRSLISWVVMAVLPVLGYIFLAILISVVILTTIGHMCQNSSSFRWATWFASWATWSQDVCKILIQ